MLVLVFYLGDVMYLIKYDKVREVSPMVMLKKIPHASSDFAGFFNYRGQLVPVVDLCAVVHKKTCRMRLSTRIILIEYQKGGESRLLGLMAERVTDAVRKPAEAFLSTGINLRDAPYLDECVLENDKMIYCINLDRLVEELDFLQNQPHAPLQLT